MYYLVCYWVLVRKGASYREILTNKEEKTKEREREDMREKELGNVRKRENETKGWRSNSLPTPLEHPITLKINTT